MKNNELSKDKNQNSELMIISYNNKLMIISNRRKIMIDISFDHIQNLGERKCWKKLKPNL